jgi:ubiquinone/menaquinone biosynthesis C-methylase UbiE
MTQPSVDQVRSYYDQFLSDQMLGYRVDGNLRIEKAIEFFTAHIRKDDVVIDVGCGIGIATEAIARKAKAGTVLGLDLSEQNIWYANKTIALPNLSFRRLDIVSDADAIMPLLPKQPSVITMCDVLEHIPQDAVADMFRLYARIGAPDLKVLLTFPSGHHLELLRRESPEKVQIIDNPISAEFLAREAGYANLSISYFRVMDIAKHGDYVHCMLERTEALQEASRRPVHRSLSVRQRLYRKFVRPAVRRKRRERYIVNVFQIRNGSSR